jgi:hypothetical protein
MVKETGFLLFRFETTNSLIRAYNIYESNPFHFVVLWKLLNGME